MKRFVARVGSFGVLALAVSPVVASVAGAALVTACGDDCTCGTPEVTVVVAGARTPDVVSVTASGVACAGVTASCDQPGPTGCIEYSIVPSVAGECDVTVAFTDQTTQEQSFVFGGDQPTCCGDLSGGGEVNVKATADGGAG